MVRLREIPRTATFAWSAGPQSPSIVTGTRAGALDAGFSADSLLELWDLGLDDPTPSDSLSPVASVVTEAKFHDIAWNKQTGSYAAGIIAGALENGALQLWDAAKLAETPNDASITSTTRHASAIKAVRFNRADGNLIATAGVQGELYLTDLNNASSPIRVGSNLARADDIECLDWNYKPQNIFATGSAGGAIVVWDTKAKDKKDMLTISNVGRRPVSSVCWDPNVSTRLASATSSDQDPAIHVWDLRKASEPERTLKGHELGILSLAWCPMDSNLLLSCGKDNRNICWNPNSGLAYGEYSVATNWAFTTRWCPTNPDLFATAAFDGVISLHTLQNANQSEKVDETAADGEDFFSQTRQVPRGPTFSLKDAPSWKKTRCGASFGFGGRLVHFRCEKGSTRSRITIEDFHLDDGIVSKAQEFETAIKAGNIADICKEKIQLSSSEDDKADWQILQNLEQAKLRDTIRQHLGYSDSKAIESATSKDQSAPDTALATDDDEDDFAALLAASKNSSPKEPFQIHPKVESDLDKSVTSALVVGDFGRAMDICIGADRMADAFMIATCGGKTCTEKIQRVYLEKHASSNSCMRLLSAVSQGSLRDIVEHADVGDWKDIMITLCSYASDDQFHDLCESLGDRLQAAGASRKDSSFCYLVGSKLPKVVKAWMEMLHENEAREVARGEGDTTYSIYARSLQDFIQKVTVFRRVTSFQDRKPQDGSWPLASLYDKYIEFAEVLAAHGQMDLAAKYYDLLPAEYPCASIVQQRVKIATQKGAPKTVRSAAPVTSGPGSFAPGQTRAPASNPAPRAYAPSGYQPSQAGYNPPSQVPMYGHVPQTPAYSVGQAPTPPNAMQPPPPPPPQRAPGEGAPKPGNTINWNDTPDNFFSKTAVPRRNTPGPSQPLTPNIYSAPVPKPVALPPPPKVGQMSKPSTPVTTTGIERPPSVTSTKTYTPLTAQQAPAPNGYPSYTAPMANAPTRSPYAPPPPSAAPSSHGPSQIQSSSGPYAPSAVRQQSNSAAVPPPPPPGRYAPAASQQGPSHPASASANPATNNGFPPQTAQTYGRPNGLNGPLGPAVPSGPGPVGPPPAGPGPSYQARPADLAPAAPLAPPPRGPAKQARAPEQTQAVETAAAAQAPVAELSGDAKFIKDVLTSEMQKISASAPPQFQAKVLDMQQRLEVLYRHLRDQDLLRQDTVAQMRQVCQHMRTQDWTSAQPVFEAMMRDKQETEGGQWMVGVKRLIRLNVPTA